jgi:hypothetical protein
MNAPAISCARALRAIDELRLAGGVNPAATAFGVAKQVAKDKLSLARDRGALWPSVRHHRQGSIQASKGSRRAKLCSAPP